MMKRISCLFVVALCLCLLAGNSWAATAGKITGRVTDQSGKPLPGVNVAVQGTRLGAVSDADGIYLILSVEPGAYELKASIIGYETVRERNVEVFSDRTTTRNFTLKETAVAGAEVVVQAQRPLVEVDKTGSEAKISMREIAQVPIIRSTMGVINYVSGVSPTRSSAGGAQVRREHGYLTQFWQTWTLDGVELTNIDTGRQWSIRQYTNLPVTSLGEVSVVKGGASASQAGVVSGVVNLVTREGTREFHGGIDYRMTAPGKKHRGSNVYDARPGVRGGTNGIWQDRLKWGDPSWESEIDPVTGKTIHVKQDYTKVVGHFAEGWLSGPLGEKATLFVSGQTDRGPTTFPGPKLHALSNYTFFGKLAFTPTPNLQLRLGYNHSKEQNWVGDVRGANLNLFMLTASSSGRQVHLNNALYLTATHTINPKTYHEFQVSFYRTARDTADFATTTTPFRKDKAGVFNLDRQNRSFFLDFNRRYNLRYDFTSQVTRRNLFKTGVQHRIYHNWNVEFSQASATSATIFVIAKDSTPGRRYLAQNFTWYAEDKIEFQGLVMNMGLRFDALWGGSTKTLGSWYKSMPGHRTFNAYLTRTPREPMKPLINLSPRFAVSHPITARSTIRFDFGRYYKPPHFGMMWSEGWQGNDVKNHPELDGTWQDEPWAPGGGWRLDSGFHKPAGAANTTEFEVGGEWNFVGDFVLDMGTYYRRTEWANGANVRYFQDPDKGALLIQGQTPSARVEAKGVEVSLFKPLSHNFSFRASLDVGWAWWYRMGPGPHINFYPDSTYIASPNYFLVDAKDNPRPLTVKEIQDLGTKANRTIRNILERQGVGDILGTVRTGVGTLRPFKQHPNLSAKEREMSEIQGLWFLDSYWANKGFDVPPPPTTYASFQFLWNTPPNWGPGPTVGGSKLLGGIQANLIWRFDNGEIIRYTPPGTTNLVFRLGPMFVQSDLNFQKTFNMEKVKPTIYVEVFNVFDSYLDRTGTTNYIRWGLKLPPASDPLYQKYGDPSPFRGGSPRRWNVGLRVGF